MALKCGQYRKVAHCTSVTTCPALTRLHKPKLTGLHAKAWNTNESSKPPAALVESTVCPPDRMSLLVPAPKIASPLDADNVLTRKRIRNSRVSTAKPACAQVVVD